jgi:hypothetical protein
MRNKALADQTYELIKGHILDPENSPLPDNLQEQFSRETSVAKVMDKNPTMKHAIAIHKSKYTHINTVTAYRDLHLARRLYNTWHTFDFDFWQTWLINSITENITRCRNNPTVQNKRIIVMEHANLIKAIGEKPQELPDPDRNEKHSFYLLMQINNNTVKFDLNNLHKLPPETLQELNKALVAGSEIDDDQAGKIMNS